MESQPQNPEFRNYPENFHPWTHCFSTRTVKTLVRLSQYPGLSESYRAAQPNCWVSHRTAVG